MRFYILFSVQIGLKSSPALLDQDWIAKLKKKNMILIGTATHLQEAILLKNAGINIVVAQGIEAGGHRGTFLGDASMPKVSLHDLVFQLTRDLEIPIIAAGGIMNCSDIKTAMHCGASGVQMGTAFLTCYESGTSSIFKKILLNQESDNTVLTRAFSGKYARGIHNKFIQRMEGKCILDYPIQNALTNQMRKIAKEKSNSDFMSLWAGTGAQYCIETSAPDLVSTLITAFEY